MRYRGAGEYDGPVIAAALACVLPREVLEKHSMTGDHILPIVVDPEIAMDIDDEHSLRQAEKTGRRFGMRSTQ